MAKTVDKQIEKFFKIRANMDGAGYYQKQHGANVGTIKWFDKHPQPNPNNEWIYYGPDPDITTVEDGIVKGDRTKIENLFNNTIDQISFSTPDYNRLRKLIIDLYASHRSLATFSIQASDPHSLSNSDLDELFRSFGYPHSTPLHGIDENPLEQKVQFFLDLVNLYKVKGTPQSLVDVLQYYGVTELDIYEFFIKRSDPNTLMFEGKAVAGTSLNPSIIQLPYSNLTSLDPHWMYTAQQILKLNQINSINLPSKTPYLGVQPIVDVDGSEVSILVRKVQDQYDFYYSTGSLPAADAEIEYIGEVRTLLELYLSIIYMFNNLFDVGSYAPSFICYDGTNTSTADILAEYDLVTQRPTSRAGQKVQLIEYYNKFTRPTASNFLQTKTDAGLFLALIAPDIKAQLDSAGDPLDVLYSLMKDLALWVKNNIGFGFINFGFILFGIDAFFSDLKPVIDFFKPYRARLLLLEALQAKNRLFNSIVIEDELSLDINLQFNDFMTADSIACCGEDVEIEPSTIICEGGTTSKCEREFIVGVPPSMNWKGLWLSGLVYSVNDVVPDYENNQYICIQSHTSSSSTKPPFGAGWTTYWSKISEIVCTDTTGATYYSRETYDCGSNYDYGAAIDEMVIEVTDVYRDHMRCPVDSTAFIVSEIVGYDYHQPSFSYEIFEGISEFRVQLNNLRTDIDYSVGATLRNSTSSLPSIYDFVIKDKTVSSFTVQLSSPTDSTDYTLDWFVVDSTSNSGIVQLESGITDKTIIFPQLFSNYSLSVLLSNNGDINPSIFPYSVEKDSTGFSVHFSSPIDSTNYSIEWCVFNSGTYGNKTIPLGLDEVTIPISGLSLTQYPVIAEIISDSTSSIFSYIVTERTLTDFTILLSSPTDSTGFSVSWVIPDIPKTYEFDYYQTSGFRNFDEEGVFDCTHGFDVVHIYSEYVPPIGNLLLENDFKILQENSGGILL